MLRPHYIVTINEKVLPFLTRGFVRTSRNSFTDTAQIELPNRISTRGKRISDLIPKGGNIKIEVGYYPNIRTIFEGYISDVIPEKTCLIKCEDEAYKLKRQSIGKDIVLKNTSTAELLNTCLDELPNNLQVAFRTGSNNIGDWKVSKTSTLIDVVAELQDKFRIYCYFRNKKLIVGADADDFNFQDITAKFERGNVPIGQNSFNFKEASADNIVVKATSISRSGEITEAFAYYDANELKTARVAPTSGTISEFNIGGQSEFSYNDLEALAVRRLEALSFTGVDGSITIYAPIQGRFVTHGDNLDVISLDIPEKDGLYKVVENEISFGEGVGIKQKVGLGIKVND